jgi:hypothetical protein
MAVYLIRPSVLFHLAGLAGLLILVGLPSPSFAQTEAEAILRAARVNPLGNQITLNAQLRSGRTNTPFQIVVDGKVSYEFENPSQALILDLGDDESRLTERKGSKNAPVKAARYDERVRGTDISFEDLALKFLYWKHPKIIGEETIKTQKSWIFEIQAPRGQSQYGVVRLWIAKEQGTLMQVEGYDPQGRLIRRFQVLTVQRIDGQWMLKTMRIETLNPETKKVISRTYLDVLGKAGA